MTGTEHGSVEPAKAKVVDLMAALEASLAEAKQWREERELAREADAGRTQGGDTDGTGS